MGEITFIVLWLYYRIVLVYSHKNVFKNSRTRLEYVAIPTIQKRFISYFLSYFSQYLTLFLVRKFSSTILIKENWGRGGVLLILNVKD